MSSERKRTAVRKTGQVESRERAVCSLLKRSLSHEIGPDRGRERVASSCERGEIEAAGEGAVVEVEVSEGKRERERDRGRERERKKFATMAGASRAPTATTVKTKPGEKAGFVSLSSFSLAGQSALFQNLISLDKDARQQRRQ